MLKIYYAQVEDEHAYVLADSLDEAIDALRAWWRSEWPDVEPEDVPIASIALLDCDRIVFPDGSDTFDLEKLRNRAGSG